LSVKLGGGLFKLCDQTVTTK